MSDLFNPLAMPSLAHSIVTRMMEMDAVPLGDAPRFPGAGLYAIYYSGGFPTYALLADANRKSATRPIYVGKAVPSGGRKGLDVAPLSETHALADRIRQHAASVRSADNLDIGDFQTRWLIVEDVWIPLGESALIRDHRPVWNAIVDGFGNHDPGSGRINGLRSRWDTLHPGRPWASKFPARGETPEEIQQEIVEYLRSRMS